MISIREIIREKSLLETAGSVNYAKGGAVILTALQIFEHSYNWISVERNCHELQLAVSLNLKGNILVGLYQAASNRETGRTAELQAIVTEMGANVYNLKPERSSYLRGMKCALSVLGYCRNIMA